MANRWWVGGSGNWNDTAHWSSVGSGGASGATVPVAADTVIFDAASNATSYTVTINQAAVGTTFTVGDPATGTVSFTTDADKTRTLTLSGNMTVAATFTCSGNSATDRLLIQSNTLGTARTITAAAVALTNCDFMDITGAGAATWRGLAGSELITTAADRDFSSDSGNWGKQAGVSITAGVLRATGAGSSYVNFAYRAASGVKAGKIYKVIYDVLNYVSGQVAVNCGAYQNGDYHNTNGTYIDYVTVTNPGSNAYLYFMSGSASFYGDIDNVSLTELSDLGDCLGNSGITFAPAMSMYWYTTTTGTKTWSTAGNWFLGSGGTGGAGRVPLPQDTAIFDAGSVGAASTAISADMPRLGKGITWTGVTNSPTWSNSAANTIYGSVTLTSGVTLSGTSGTTFSARSSVALTSAGRTWTQALTFSGPGGTFTLADALSTNGALTVISGTFDDGGFGVTASSITGQTGSTIRRRATNLAATGATGSVGAAATAALTGTAATASVGDPGIGIGLVGTAATASVGDPGIGIGLTGTAAAASVGDPGVTFSIGLPGADAAGVTGTLAVTMGIGLTGVAATTGISITVPTTVLALTGVAATVSVGDVGIGIGLTGVSGAGAAGSVSIPVNGVLTREASRYEFLRTAQTTAPT